MSAEPIPQAVEVNLPRFAVEASRRRRNRRQRPPRRYTWWQRIIRRLFGRRNP